MVISTLEIKKETIVEAKFWKEELIFQSKTVHFKSFYDIYSVYNDRNVV